MCLMWRGWDSPCFSTPYNSQKTSANHLCNGFLHFLSHLGVLVAGPEGSHAINHFWEIPIEKPKVSSKIQYTYYIAHVTWYIILLEKHIGYVLRSLVTKLMYLQWTSPYLWWLWIGSSYINWVTLANIGRKQNWFFSFLSYIQSSNPMKILNWRRLLIH